MMIGAPVGSWYTATGSPTKVGERGGAGGVSMTALGEGGNEGSAEKKGAFFTSRRKTLHHCCKQITIMTRTDQGGGVPLRKKASENRG